MYMRVSINGDSQKWVVYFMENPKIKWMRTGGTPILGNLHIYIYVYPDDIRRYPHKLLA
jgi:hypothetical protein